MTSQGLRGLAEEVIGVRGKKVLKYGLLRARTIAGKPPFTGLGGLDKRILEFLPRTTGFFVEAGANDGIDQSNTYYLEQCLGWKGLLIEPVPELARLARRFRRSPVENYALGPPERSGESISFTFSDLTTGVGKSGRPIKWSGLLGPNPTTAAAELRTLSDLLDRHNVRRVDLLSLDVEGFENEVLRGLDLSRHQPELILVETADPVAVLDSLHGRYRVLDKLSHHDFLLRRV